MCIQWCIVLWTSLELAPDLLREARIPHNHIIYSAQTYPSRTLITIESSLRWSILHSSWDNFNAAARTSRVDLRPILEEEIKYKMKLWSTRWDNRCRASREVKKQVVKPDGGWNHRVTIYGGDSLERVMDNPERWSQLPKRVLWHFLETVKLLTIAVIKFQK